MKEAQHINKSLSALGDVMEALDQKKSHIPYRYNPPLVLLYYSLYFEASNDNFYIIHTIKSSQLPYLI